MFPVPIPLPMVIYLLAGLLIGAPVVMWVARISPVQAGWRWGGWRMVVLGGGWGGLLAVAGVAWLRMLIHTGNYLPIPISPTPFDWLLLIVLAPFAEELFFRGAIFGGLQRTWHPFWAVIISAVICTLTLPVQIWTAFVFLCGMAYALAFRGSGSVLTPMLAHVTVVVTLLLARLHPGGVQRLPADLFFKLAAIALVMLIIGSIPSQQKSE